MACAIPGYTAWVDRHHVQGLRVRGVSPDQIQRFRPATVSAIAFESLVVTADIGTLAALLTLGKRRSASPHA